MDCTKHGIIEEQIKTIHTRLATTEKLTHCNSKEIAQLKENKASNDEKFERVFEMLQNLKASVDKVQQAIESNNERLPNFVYAVSGSIITGVIVWLVTRG